MNNSLSAYTHLESLLLFQSLHAYGVGNHVFGRISELLKSNPHITQDKSFQSGRLSPDALRNVYLLLLKDEIKSEQNDDAIPDVKNSRKRKAPSPTLPSIQESVQHEHLIPKLVNKLYARYRSEIANQIRHDEEQYERLQRELQGIEHGEWDDFLRNRANGKAASRSPTVSRTSQKPPEQKSESESIAPDTPRPVPTPTPAPTDTQQQQQQQTPVPVEPNTKPTPTPTPTPRKKSTPAPGPATPQPPLAPVPPQNRPAQPPLPPSRYAQQQPPVIGPNGSPYPHRSPYPQAQSQFQPPNSQPAGSPHPPQVPAPSGNHSGPFLQPHPGQPFAGNGVPQYGPPPNAPPQFSPTHQRFPGPFQGPQGPQSPGVQQQRNHVPYAGQPPYPPQQQMGQPPPPQGGFMLPPFQVSPQDPSRAHQQPAAPPQYPQVSTPANPRQAAKGTPQSSSVGRPGVPATHPLVTQARLNFSTPTGVRTPHGAISTPRSAKSIIKASAKSWSAPADIKRPPVSPIDDVVVPSSQAKSKAPRKSRAKGKAKEKEPEKEPDKETQPDPEGPAEDAAPEVETRQGRSRRKAPAKKTRPGSLASSHAGTSVRERSRSRSIISHTETIAADNESQAGGRIKSERGTSIDVIDEDLMATPQMTTRRRGTAQHTQQPGNKRKRNAREVTPEDEERSGTPGLPKTVVAVRHFSRMCAPLMNDISSHKHASIFTTAVRAKDAEGYYEIIKRPTDLKTIQKAITAGAKQVTAAATGDTPAGSPGGGGSVVELALVPENIPPKAIVNAGQLEKELMRMFVNAVMFNAGEEGVVEDARETFESVQQSVSSWRSVERGSGRLEVEETPPVQDDDGPTASKRRKL